MKLTTAVLGAVLVIGAGAASASAAPSTSDAKALNALRATPSKSAGSNTVRVVTLPTVTGRGAVWLPKVTR